MGARIHVICNTLLYVIINYHYVSVHFLRKCCIYYYEVNIFQFIENVKVDQGLGKIGKLQKLNVLKFLFTFWASVS
jgi:hypothetical protein